MRFEQYPHFLLHYNIFFIEMSAIFIDKALYFQRSVLRRQAKEIIDYHLEVVKS